MKKLSSANHFTQNEKAIEFSNVNHFGENEKAIKFKDLFKRVNQP